MSKTTDYTAPASAGQSRGKTLPNIVDEAYDAVTELENADAILIEIEHYFADNIEPDTWQACTFVRKFGHIRTLLHICGDFLAKSLDGMRKAAGELEQYKLTEGTGAKPGAEIKPPPPDAVGKNMTGVKPRS